MGKTMKVEIFRSANGSFCGKSKENIQSEINEWLEETNVDIVHVSQSETETEMHVMVWYTEAKTESGPGTDTDQWDRFFGYFDECLNIRPFLRFRFGNKRSRGWYIQIFDDDLADNCIWNMDCESDYRQVLSHAYLILKKYMSDKNNETEKAV